MGRCANGSLGYGAPSKGYNRETATAKLFPLQRAAYATSGLVISRNTKCEESLVAGTPDEEIRPNGGVLAALCVPA